MLMSLLVLYLLGGSGTFPLVAELDHAKTLIKAEVAEGPHRTELLEVIDRAEHSAKASLEKRKKTSKELLELVHKYDAPADDIQAKLEQQRAESAAYQEEMIQYRFDLKGKMSRAEWAKAFPAARQPSRP